MPTDVIMPQMGESIFEGTITKWLKKPGDKVEKDEPLLEISTDKVDAEIPAPVAGVLSEIKVPEGATVQVDTVIAVIGGAIVASSPAAAPQATAALAPPVPQAPPAAASTGGVNVVMPQMGESIFEGTITRWLKRPGDKVEKDEPLLEISTDKVDAEIPAPVAGILTQIVVPEGATVQVNTVVAVIGGSAAPVAATPAAAAPAQAAASAAQPVVAAIPQVEGRRIRSSPLVRRMARENQLDLNRIAGTGSDGRITKEDVLRHLSQHGPGSTKPTPAAAPPKAEDKVVPLTRMRAIIAERMHESKRISPHVHVVYKIDMTRIARLRERQRAAFEQRHGVKLTYMPFVTVAVVEALRHHPILNASLLDNSIHYHAHTNIGIAVALEWGLIVPVIRQAESLSFVSIAKAVSDLAGRARTKKLSPDEVQGATFTLTNFGIFGGEFGTPILNQPESAILAIGGLRKEPVVLTDADGNDTIAIRAMQSYCLGFDHRLIDGADAGKFMLAFKHTLENWDREIL